MNINYQMGAILLAIVAFGAWLIWGFKPKKNEWGAEQEDAEPFAHPDFEDTQPKAMVTGAADMGQPLQDVMPFPVLTEAVEDPLQALTDSGQALEIAMADPFPESDVMMGVEPAAPIDVAPFPDDMELVTLKVDKETADFINTLPFPDETVAQVLELVAAEPFPESDPAPTLSTVDPRIAELEGICNTHRAVIANQLEEIRSLAEQLGSLRGQIGAAVATKNDAYNERNRVVAALATCYPATKYPTDIEGWDKHWQNCVRIDLPTGQVSWHYHDNQKHLFSHVPRRKVAWDGHTTAEKYKRIEKFTREYEPARVAAIKGKK